MLLTLTTTHRPATDLGYLLHKNPARVHDFELAFGRAKVFFPEATDERCTAVLLLDVDPVELARGRADRGLLLGHYVNDRPYAVSSFLSVALSKIFGTALGGRSKERQSLADSPIPLRAELATLPSRGGPELIRKLFEPLGYRFQVKGSPLDSKRPEWGESPYYHTVLENECRLSELLRHIVVLAPVLDDRKHYWIGEDEIERLMRRGEGWLANHPERDLIVRRALRHQRHLTHEALERLLPQEGDPPEDRRPRTTPGLHQLRLVAVSDELEALQVRRVLDLGCGEGKLLKCLLGRASFEKIVGVDANIRALKAARRRLRLEDASARLLDRIQLIQGALTYRDDRLKGYDAAVLVEVIEHLDPARLASLERVVWEFAQPESIIVTTPNRDYNVKYEGMVEGSLRHHDHRFEWTREEFERWAMRVAGAYGYRVRLQGIGDEDAALGQPTQMAVFAR